MAKQGQKPAKKTWAGSKRNLAKFKEAYIKVVKPSVDGEE